MKNAYYITGRFCCFAFALVFSCADGERINPCDKDGDAPNEQACLEKVSGSCDDGDKCNGKCYNKATEFCSVQDNKIYRKCEDSEYNTETHFCLSDKRTPKCGGYEFEAWQFCLDGVKNSKCGKAPDGKEVRDQTEECCGTDKYTIATQFCYSSTSKVGNLCGTRTETYDPEKYECGSAPNTNWIYLKDEVSDESGISYKAVLIGTQTWLAKNLNNAANGSKCGNNTNNTSLTTNANDCNTYGRLYNWDTAMTVCPGGWHLPSDAEWTTLTDYVGGSSTAGTKLKATSGWTSTNGAPAGTDDYGFSALPGGIGNSDGNFSDAGKYGYWWSASDNSYGASRLGISYITGSVLRGSNSKSYLYSVRCLKNPTI